MVFRMQAVFLILLLIHASISSALRMACISADGFSSSNGNFFPSSEVKKSITEIARRNDIVLIQGIQDSWLNYIHKMLNSKLQVYSLILAQPNGNQRHAYLFKTEKIKLLNEFNRSLEGDATGISSVLVKDLKSGLPDFVLHSSAKDVQLPATASGTDMTATVSDRLLPTASMSQKQEKVTDHKGRHNSCSYCRIFASESLMNGAVITPLQGYRGIICAYDYSVAEFFIASQQGPHRLLERASNGSSDPPAVLKSSAKGIQAAEAVGAALGSILIFCIILCVICCCINKRCGYQRIV